MFIVRHFHWYRNVTSCMWWATNFDLGMVLTARGVIVPITPTMTWDFVFKVKSKRLVLFTPSARHLAMERSLPTLISLGWMQHQDRESIPGLPTVNSFSKMQTSLKHEFKKRSNFILFHLVHNTYPGQLTAISL